METFLNISEPILTRKSAFGILTMSNMKVNLRFLKDKSGVDKIIVKKQPYQLLNTNREFFPSFDASNFHTLDDKSSQVRPNILAILYFVLVCEGAIRRLSMLVV